MPAMCRRRLPPCPWRAAARPHRPGAKVASLAAVLLIGCIAALPGSAQTAAPPAALPPDAAAALQRAHVPPEALSLLLQEVGNGRTLLALRAETPVNPASLFKLLTTYAALDLLGPAWTWSTPVWIQGTLRNGVLDGAVIVKGTGDPKLVLERVWLLLERVQQLGVREIHGDIVLDRSAFATVDGTVADFDGEPTRPYNVRPDALLLNFKSVSYGFVPDAARGIAVVTAEPRLAEAPADRQVPLTAGPCDDWRGALKANFTDPGSVRFAGSYPASCGVQAWPVADVDPASYNARLIAALWRQMGGVLTGSVHEGKAPTATPPSFELRSPPLAEVVRDINKFSNNVMAQQLFLSLALARAPGQPATPEAARETLRLWVQERLGAEAGDGLVIDNGSGLSRDSRLTARFLARLLQQAWAGPLMPELLSSLPVAGVDGTVRKLKGATGRAHLKTGSLRDVVGVAGYVLSDSGRRYVLVAIVNHPNANAARPAIDAVVQWVARDAPLTRPTPPEKTPR